MKLAFCNRDDETRRLRRFLAAEGGGLVVVYAGEGKAYPLIPGEAHCDQLLDRRQGRDSRNHR